MPTLNPRVSVTLKPKTAAILLRVSELTKQSQSKMISELLESSEPVFERIIQVLTAALLVTEDLKESTRRSLESAESKLHEQLGLNMDIFDNLAKPLLDHAESINRRERKDRRDALDAPAETSAHPPYLTGGSGSPKTSTKTIKTPAKTLSEGALLKKASQIASKRPLERSNRKVKG